MAAPILITSVQEFKEHIPVTIDFNWDIIQPFIRKAENSVLKYYLGKDLMAELPSSTGDLSEVFSYAQAAAATFAFLDYIPFGQVDISNAGISINSSENTKTAFQWQISDLKDSTRELAFQAIEDMLSVLEDLKPESWNYAQVCLDMKGIIFTSAADFQRYFNINSSRRTFTALVPVIRKAQRLHLATAFTPETYASILTIANTIESDPENTAILSQALDLAKSATANYAIFRAATELFLDVSADGITVSERSEETSLKRSVTPKVDPVKDLKEIAWKDAESFLKQLHYLVYANADLFAYVEPGTDTDATLKIVNTKESGIFAV